MYVCMFINCNFSITKMSNKKLSFQNGCISDHFTVMVVCSYYFLTKVILLHFHYFAFKLGSF